jgi:hypothetical protein
MKRDLPQPPCPIIFAWQGRTSGDRALEKTKVDLARILDRVYRESKQ